MNVHIETIPPKDQRYPTCGDWYWQNGNMVVKVSESKDADWRKEFLVGIHEAIEAALCRHRGISLQEVDDFDLSHLESDQPGEERDAPYKREHMVATAIEMILASELGVDWDEYEDNLQE